MEFSPAESRFAQTRSLMGKMEFGRSKSEHGLDTDLKYMLSTKFEIREKFSFLTSFFITAYEDEIRKQVSPCVILFNN